MIKEAKNIDFYTTGRKPAEQDFASISKYIEKEKQNKGGHIISRRTITLTMDQLTKDISTIDFEDILSCWTWKTTSMKAVAAISVLGDLFLVGKDEAVYWLQTDGGELTKVAEDLQQFEQFLDDEEKVDNWLLPLLVEKLITAGKTLKENEVYSFRKFPIIGGDYSVENIEPTDMSTHFALTGQISEQLKDLPEGTKVKIVYK